MKANSDPSPTLSVGEMNRRFSGAAPDELLRWATKEFGPDIVFACSFGVEDMVLLDLLARHDLPIRVFTLDTGRLHQETYDVMERARERYGIHIQIFHPKHHSVEELVSQRGPNSFYHSIEERRACCDVRKVEPLKRALFGKRAWVTGLRATQSITRHRAAKVERDDTFGGLYKLNPLLDWNEDEVWQYAADRSVPTHALHAQGYPSIGCAPCTRAVEKGEDLRAGRWWWEQAEQKECGLHPRRRPLKSIPILHQPPQER